MYEILVEAPQFKGLTIVKQHRLITEVFRFDKYNLIDRHEIHCIRQSCYL